MSMFDESTRAVFEELEAGTAFKRDLEGQIAAMGSQLEATFADIPTEFNSVSPEIANRISGLAISMPDILEKVAPFAEHVTKQFDGLAQNMGLFSSAQRLENEMAGGETNACGDMHDFFGSITQAGPSRVEDMKAGADSIIERLQQFKTSYTSLQSTVQTMKVDLQSAIQSEISATTNNAGKVSQLQGFLTRVQSEFATSYASERTDLINEVATILTGARQTSINAKGAEMQAVDNALDEHSNQIASVSDQLTTLSGELSNIVSSEEEKFSNATKRLTTLGEASSIRSLFASNACAQTLMGYVGTDSFLSKLG